MTRLISISLAGCVILLAAKLAAAETFVHPSGLSVSLPANWTVRGDGGVVQLVPPDASSNAQGPTEAYLLLVGPTHGATQIDDANLAAVIDSQISQLAPFLHHTQPAATFDAADRKGLLMQWEGVNPQSDRIGARMYMVMGDAGWMGSILVLAHTDRLQAREPELNQIAASLRVATPLRDPNIVGKWVYTKTSSYVSGDFSMATMTRSTAILSADGRCTLRQTSQVAGGSSDVTADTGEDGSGVHGTWFASNGMICIVTDQIVVNARYATDGTNLRIVASDMDRIYSRR